MNGGIVTECPECETRFNVSEGQLKLAGGRVRCGACLRVFDARTHKPSSGTPQPQPEAGSNINTEERPAVPGYSLHVRHAQAPRVSTATEMQRPPGPANRLNSADDPAAFDPDAPLDLSSPAKGPQAQAPRDGRRPAEKPSAPIPIASFLRTPAQDGRPEERPEAPASMHHHAATGAPPPQIAAEPVAEPIAAEGPVHDPDGTPENITLSKREPEPEPESIREAPAAETNRQPVHAPPRQAAAPVQTEPQPAPQARPQPQPTPQPQGLAALQDLHAEPLELMHPVAPPAPGAVLGWSLGCLAACVLLASQLAWFNRIEWSREPLLADAYDILCHQIECAIPPYQAVELIHNRQLVVRAHPRFEDALSIDLLLENTASFRQPFPAIELSFSDIRGRIVARRVLQPRDYLDDILDPLKMPHSQPFQVNLAILDPGRRAVSYEVQLAPAQL